MAAANAALPIIGGCPVTRKTTSSAIRLCTVSVSPAFVASIQVATSCRISCSSLLIVVCSRKLGTNQLPGRIVPQWHDVVRLPVELVRHASRRRSGRDLRRGFAGSRRRSGRQIIGRHGPRLWQEGTAGRLFLELLLQLSHLFLERRDSLR